MGFNLKKVGSGLGKGLATRFGGIYPDLFGGGGSGKNKGFKGPQVPSFEMRKTTDFIQNDAAPQIGGPSGRQDLQKAFAGLRERAGQKAGAQLRDNTNALQRRFAAMGASGSGANIAALQKAQESANQLQQGAEADIGFEEINALQNRDLAQADMDFKQKVFNFDRGSKMHELDLAERQQKISAAESQYNAKLNEFLNKPPKEGFLSNVIGELL